MIVLSCQLEALFGYRLFESIEEASTPYTADTRFVLSDHRVMFGRGKALDSSWILGSTTVRTKSFSQIR